MIYIIFTKSKEGFQDIKYSVNAGDYIKEKVAVLDAGGLITKKDCIDFVKRNEVTQRWLRQERFNLVDELGKMCYNVFVLRGM